MLNVYSKKILLSKERKMTGLGDMRRKLREKYERLKTDEAWKVAEKFLRNHGNNQS